LKGKVTKKHSSGSKASNSLTQASILSGSQVEREHSAPNSDRSTESSEPSFSPLPTKRGPNAKKKTAVDRLAEISMLQQKIAKEKQALMRVEASLSTHRPQKVTKKNMALELKASQIPAEVSDDEGETHEDTLPQQIEDIETHAEEEEEDREEDLPHNIRNTTIKRDSVSSVEPSAHPVFELSNSVPVREKKKEKKQGKHGEKRLRPTHALQVKSALMVQKHVRRWRAVRIVNIFRVKAHAAVLRMQVLVRRKLATVKVSRMILHRRAAVCIQRYARGYIIRVIPLYI
jgi:hypothetical protein